MVFNSLEMGSAEILALSHVERRQEELALALRVTRRWIGLFRRQTLARAIQASLQLSGSAPGIDDVLAAIDGDETFEASGPVRDDLRAYHDAWGYLSQVAGDPLGRPRLDPSILRSIHFLLTRHSPAASPGRWRHGPADGHSPAGDWPGTASPGTDGAGEVPMSPPELVDELTSRLEDNTNHALVKGALAHLWVTLARPFAAGNDKVARLAHAMVLEANAPTQGLWVGIDEYLAANTEVYREVLAEVADRSGRWAGDPTPWIRFCLTAHYRQAAILLGRLQDAEKLWATCTLLAVDHDVPVRCVGPLSEAAQGLRLRNATYRAAVRLSETPEQGDITEQTASRDLKALVDCGLLNYMGEKRSRVYRGGVMLRAAWAQVRSQRKPTPEDQGPAADDPLAPGFAT